MEWLQQNWFWLVVFVTFFAVHFFGHGGHGGGGCGGGHGRHRPPDKPDKEEKQAGPPPGHQH